MLVRGLDGGAWMAIGQASHAWASGQLARAWGNERFPRPEPFEAVCLAAEQHDVGMAEWDRAPALDPETGRALAFTAMPRPVHLALWGAAAAKLETQIATLLEKAEKAEARGDTKAAGDARNSASTYQEWLEQARKAVADYSG